MLPKFIWPAASVAFVVFFSYFNLVSRLTNLFLVHHSLSIAMRKGILYVSLNCCGEFHHMHTSSLTHAHTRKGRRASWREDRHGRIAQGNNTSRAAPHPRLIQNSHCDAIFLQPSRTFHHHSDATVSSYNTVVRYQQNRWKASAIRYQGRSQMRAGQCSTARCKIGSGGVGR